MLYRYVNLVLWFAAVILISWALDRLWARSLARWLYIAFAAPGIVVHELSHYIACKLTGAKVARVVLISREGGSVTHGPPKGGIVGQALISMAPFFGIPIVIILLGLVFDHLLGCSLSWDLDISGSPGKVLLDTLGATFDLIKVNIFDLRAYWFLLYLYFCASGVVALSPSAQDIRNGIPGLAAILLGALVWILLIGAVAPSWHFPVLGAVMDILGWVVVVGLIAGLLALVLALPFFIIRKLMNR